MTRTKILRSVFSVFGSLALLSCGGGGSSGNSGGTVEGLQMASTMSVLSSKEDNQVKPLSTAFSKAYRALTAQTFSPGSDYELDITRTYVWDESMQPLETVNMILCLMDQTRASEMVNKGPYIALVNEDKCEQGKNNSGAASGGGSSNQVTEYKQWTVESIRASNSTPQRVNIWIPGDPPQQGCAECAMDAQDILVEVTVTQGVGPGLPFGRFVLNFKGVADAALVGGTPGDSATMMVGTLRTVDRQDGKPQFQFINLSGSAAFNFSGIAGIPFGQDERSNVLFDDSGGDTGMARTSLTRSGNISETHNYTLAFNLNNMLRSDGVNPDMCMSRSQYNTQVWRYNLYRESDGSRVRLNSGSAFTYNGKYGHVGYWGIWYEDTANPIGDGAVIDLFNYATGATDAHTVHKSGGKMHRRTAKEELLGKLVGKNFFAWVDHSTLGSPGSANSYEAWQVTVTAGYEFEISGGVNWGETGPVVTDLGADKEVIVFGVDGEQLWLWSDTLGGNMVFVYDSSLSDFSTRKVAFYAEDFVGAGDALLASASATLYCYDRCPMGGVTDLSALTEADFYYPSYESIWDGTANSPTSASGGLRTYTLGVSGGSLRLIDDTSGLAVAVDQLPAGNSWGIESGEMLLSALTDVYHPTFNAAGTTYVWDVYNLAPGSKSFRWETGSNDWNRDVTLIRNADASVVVFDAPMHFDYVHEAGNDANDNDPLSNPFIGQKMLLQYGGPGDLNGFPWQQDGSRWLSPVTLLDGVLLTGADGKNYVVRQMEREQKMKPDAVTTACDVLSLPGPGTLLLPGENDITTVTLTLAGKPAVSEAPAVIEGEIQ